MCLTITSDIICSFPSLDQKRMTELVSYLTRQRAHTPQEKVDNKQKPKEVRCSEVSLLTCFYIFWSYLAPAQLILILLVVRENNFLLSQSQLWKQ